jgi:hypothetical protein
MGKTHSKPLAARHGRGTAWARHAMCESAFSRLVGRVRHGIGPTKGALRGRKQKQKGHIHVYTLVNIPVPHYVCVRVTFRSWNSRIGSQFLSARRQEALRRYITGLHGCYSVKWQRMMLKHCEWARKRRWFLVTRRYYADIGLENQRKISQVRRQLP